MAYPLLPVAPLPQVDFPTIQVDDAASRRRSGDHGVVGDRAAGAPVRPDPWRHPDDVVQRRSAQPRSRCSSTSTATSTRAAQDIQTAINAAGGQLPKNLPSPPTYRKVNPADSPILILAVHSDLLPITVVDDYAENILVQNISPDSGRRAGQRRRPAEAGGAHPDRSGKARLHGPRPRGRARGHRQRDDRQPERQHRRRHAHLHDLRQRPTAERRAVERRDRRLPQRRARAHPRHRAGDRRAREQQARRLVERQARHSARSPQAAGRQRDRDRRPHQSGAAAAAGRDPAGDQGRHDERPDDDDPRLGQRRAVHADADRRAGRHGDLPLPAQLLGDSDPERDGAAGAGRHRSR